MYKFSKAALFTIALMMPLMQSLAYKKGLPCGCSTMSIWDMIGGTTTKYEYYIEGGNCCAPVAGLATETYIVFGEYNAFVVHDGITSISEAQAACC